MFKTISKMPTLNYNFDIIPFIFERQGFKNKNEANYVQIYESYILDDNVSYSSHNHKTTSKLNELIQDEIEGLKLSVKQ